MEIKITPLQPDPEPVVYGNKLYNAPQPAITSVSTGGWSSSSPSGVGVSGGPFLDASNSTKLDTIISNQTLIIEALRKLGLIL